MLWTPNLDPESIMEDAGKHFYGSAWSVMKKYRKLLTEAYIETADISFMPIPPWI
jgi:hypothetical protein